MLQLYYNRLSVNARRVWVTLLEKELEFESIILNLHGDQFQPKFLEINPFHHIPVLVDDGFRIIESLAILDYLEAKYHTPKLLPKEPQNLAIVRMIELVTVNELLPASIPLMRQFMELEVNDYQIEKAKEQIEIVLSFFEASLANQQPYFLGEQFTFADIVAGTAVSILPLLGVSLENYPKLTAWSENLNKRQSWQETTPSLAELEASKAAIKILLERE